MAELTLALSEHTGNDLFGEVVNQYAGITGDSKSDVAILKFGPSDRQMKVSQITFKIGSIAVGGNNNVSSTVETINVNCDWGYMNGTTFVSYGQSLDLDAPENNVPSSLSFTIAVPDGGYRQYYNGNNIVVQITVTSTQSAVGCAYSLSDFSLTVDFTESIKFTTEGVSTVFDDSISLLDVNGSNLGLSASMEAGETISVHASSFDGRKIVGFEQYDENNILIRSLSGNDLLSYLAADGSVLQIPFVGTESMMGHSYRTIVTFDKVVYVTYDSCFNHLKWFYEGLKESGVTLATPTWHTFACTDSSATNLWTPLFPVSSGWHWLRFDFTSDMTNPYIRIDCEEYDSNKQFIRSSNVTTASSGAESMSLADGYVRFSIRNTAIGSTVTFSNFVLYPEGSTSSMYSYMRTSLPASKRTNTGKWNMPVPTREDHRFTKWNTKPDGNGVSYTSSSPFPTEDLVLYSRWELDVGSNIYLGSTQMDVYVGNTLVDVYVGKTLI